MSIDDRIDRLTERHEALVQSIELMIIENRERDVKWDKRFGQLTSVVERVTGSVERVMNSVDKLSRIAELHQHRLDSHDDRLDELEGTA